MITFASICPHPPIIIPEIGGENLKETQSTIKALEKLASEFEKSIPELVLIISPHGPVFPDHMSIRAQQEYFGSFASFGAPEIDFNFQGDPKLSSDLYETCQKNGLPAILLDRETCQHYGIEETLDHGTLVPLYYLTTHHSQLTTPLVPIAFSYLSLEDHFKFGKIIGTWAKESGKRMAFVASGDLSHCLTYDAPGGYSPVAKEFDKKLIELLEKNDQEGILNLEPSFIEEAGECGLRSIITLLGVLSTSKIQPQILSYEGPFGVGYLVANFKIKS